MIRLLLLLPLAVSAGPYVEMKSETSFAGERRGSTVTHKRLGYEQSIYAGKIYLEGGHMTGGSSFEAGYKFKLGEKFLIKGKVEGKRTDGTKNKVETELRYTF